jgi:hypothetical protein
MLGSAFLASFLAVGIPYWHLPYGKVSLPNAVWGFPLVVVACLAALARILSAARFWRTTFIVGASVPAAVMARVIYDGIVDPTSHNLWPFELVLAAGPGLMAGLLGSLVGGMLAGLRKA